MLDQITTALLSLFALLIVGLGVAFVALRKIGVPPDQIGRRAAHVLRFLGRVPGVTRLVSFTQRYRKSVFIAGSFLAVVLLPFAFSAALLVILVVSVLSLYLYLASLIPVPNDSGYKESGLYSGVYGYDGELVPKNSADAWRRF